jgi:DICT domain-containing protein
VLFRSPDQYAAAIRASGDNLRIVFELTERALTERPSEVLRAVQHLRALGASIALDDVGVDHRSLALMPFVRPEVIKLDMSLVQGRLSPEKARTMHAVNAYAEESGAVILAEGIETEEHLARALALGSHYGQGWFFGRPQATPAPHSCSSIPSLSSVAGALPAGDTPFERVLDAGARPRTSNKRLLHALSQELEVHAATLCPEAVVLAGLQHLRHFTPATRARYVDLASRAAFVGVLGTALGAAPEPGVRGGCLDADDPLTLEWSVFVISPHFAAALVARDLGDDPSDDMERRFSYRLTYDRRQVVSAARLMMDRIAPANAAAEQLRAA